MATSFSNWDFINQHVQDESELSAGQFVSAESTLIAAGPPLLDHSPGSTHVLSNISVYPIGLLESFSLQQSKQLQKIFEIGSSRSYFIPGRVVGSITLGRTFYFGPNILKVLYAYYKNTSFKLGTKDFGTKLTVDGRTIFDPAAKMIHDDVVEAALHSLKRDPGRDHFFIDIASDLFNQPTGIAIYFKSCDSVSVGAMYLEQMYLQGHQMSIASGSALIMEGVSGQYDRIVPIEMLSE